MPRVRALYEEDVVPVREIAALAGVTERTLYKYIAKGGWRRRYRWSASAKLADAETPPLTPRIKSGAGSPHKGEGKKCWRADPRFAPVKGAGGRFIRREEAGKPFARGIKALDPQAAQEAAAKAKDAAALAARAAHLARLSKFARDGIAAQAKHERAEDARLRAFEKLMTMMRDLARARRAATVHPRADAVAEKLQCKIMDLMESMMLPSPPPYSINVERDAARPSEPLATRSPPLRPPGP